MNTIERAYQAGLNILAPSRRDLEHGLALHAESLVVDTYGFGPQAGGRAEGWAFDVEHQDVVQKAWAASGVNCIFVNAGEESNHVDRILGRLALRSYAATIAPHICSRAFQPDDIVRAGDKNLHCYYLATNGVPLSQRHESVEDELRFIRVFFQLGVRMMHLTYNRANLIGDGCGEARDGGLTDFGRAVVAEMNSVGVIVDVAHCGGQTSLEAARISNKPVVASHAMCRTLADHARGKTDETISAIADTGGYIGIMACAAFLKLSFDIKAMIEHIAYVVKHFGADHVGIGTDIGWAPNVYDAGSMGGVQPKTPPVPKSKTPRPWRSLSPINSSSALPEGWTREKEMSTAWTNFPLYTVGMVQKGISDDDIRKILGGNALRVAKALWNTREP